MATASFPPDLDRVWVYLRKSREDREAEERARQEGRTDIETLSRHRKYLLELAQDAGHDVSRVLEEVVSGEYISERPEMQRLLTAVESGEVTAVWVMDLDRLGRGDMADQGVIMRAFKDSSTLILTPEKVYDLNDDMDEEWTEFKAFFARRELKMITKRMQRGRVASVREGKFIGTRPPYGYDIAEGLLLVPNEKAAVVQEVFDLYAHQGLGCNKIARHLNTLAIPSPAGKRWRPEGVLAILGNPVYAGWMTWRRSGRDKRKHKSYRRPKSEWIQVKGKHRALIDELTFDQVQQIRAKRTHSPIRPDRKPSNPLAGLVHCGKCGSLMVKRPYSKQAAHLICKKPDCDTRSTRLSLVEDRIVSALSQWLADYTLHREELAQVCAPGLASPVLFEQSLSAVEREIRRLREQQNRLYDLLEQGVYDVNTFKMRQEAILRELNRTAQQRANVLAHEPLQQPTGPASSAQVPALRRVMDFYEKTSDPFRRNQLLKSVLEKVVYYKERTQTGEEFELELFTSVLPVPPNRPQEPTQTTHAGK
ncbi:recombinase family protein [Alicyclobacillus tolerans]|uniref:recombinase family protein n=1 Tax=Alicyclobacillus tolerans TaxID=90970 RepID=UPI001F2BB337|nr:recombinase family protein [Alicyclobacillus tolerans]MCF8566110.1 recombinase family protein [Alicyclobacillus tolerans]